MQLPAHTETFNGAGQQMHVSSSLQICANAAAIVLCVLASPAEAADMTSRMQEAHLTPGIIFSLLFLMVGPIKILIPFVNMTHSSDTSFRFRLATRAVLFAIAGLLVAGVVGRKFISNYSIPFPVLFLTGGLILLLAALRSVLEQFSGPTAPNANLLGPELKLAITPLASDPSFPARFNGSVESQVAERPFDNRLLRCRYPRKSGDFGRLVAVGQQRGNGRLRSAQ